MLLCLHSHPSQLRGHPFDASMQARVSPLPGMRPHLQGVRAAYVGRTVPHIPKRLLLERRLRHSLVLICLRRPHLRALRVSCLWRRRNIVRPRLAVCSRLFKRPGRTLHSSKVVHWTATAACDATFRPMCKCARWACLPTHCTPASPPRASPARPLPRRSAHAAQREPAPPAPAALRAPALPLTAPSHAASAAAGTPRRTPYAPLQAAQRAPAAALARCTCVPVGVCQWAQAPRCARELACGQRI